MTRRDFCQSGLASLCATYAAGAAAQAVDRAPIPAIDTHIHFYDPTRPEGVPWPQPADTRLYAPHLPDDYRRVAAPLGIVGAVVVEASPWLEDNAWILALAEANPLVVGCIGHLPPGSADFGDNLRRFAANPLFRGLRFGRSVLQGIGRPEVDRGISALTSAGLATDVLDGSSDYAGTLELARKWPSLRIVLNHVPIADWSDRHRVVLAALAAQPNVHLKISEIVRPSFAGAAGDPARYRPAIEGLLDLFGPGRLLFGSNWPVCEKVAPVAEGLRIVRACFAEQPRAVAEQFFWRNSLGVYRWVARGAAAELLSR
jgi:predicted TIM-barrel fold metal-dependent hydrolase